MKICFMICGQPRCIDLVISNIENIFFEHKINYYVCLTNNFNEYEKEYINDVNIADIIKNINIKKILLNKDYDNSSYRNSLNYSKKIKDIIGLIENEFDLYILIRSDFIFENNIFLEKIIDTDTLYFSNKNINNFINKNENSIDDSIIISKNYNIIKILVYLYEFLKKNNNYIAKVLFDYLTDNKIIFNTINIDYKLILSKCNIIAIAGDSGSGKSTLMEYLIPIFNNKNLLKLETDRYHKWERGDPNYNKYTHLNPYANHLEKMDRDIYNLKIGNEIYTVDYDHSTGKFTQVEKIESKQNIILCGLHTLYNEQTNKIIDIKIFMDTDRELIKKWKIKRDVTERGYSMDKVLNQINIREKDYEDYIKNQKENSDIIINYYEDDYILKCKIIIKNIYFFNNTLKYLICNNIFYLMEIDKIIIFLKNNYYQEIVMLIKSII